MNPRTCWNGQSKNGSGKTKQHRIFFNFCTPFSFCSITDGLDHTILCISFAQCPTNSAILIESYLWVSIPHKFSFSLFPIGEVEPSTFVPLNTADRINNRKMKKILCWARIFFHIEPRPECVLLGAETFSAATDMVPSCSLRVRHGH